jgi:hypothetical protein
MASPANSIGRSGLRLLICFIAAIAMTALLAPSALASSRYPYSGTSFGPDGIGGSASFQSLQGVAVDQTSGNVYAYDSTAGKIYKFNAAGEPLNFSALAGNAIEGVGGAGGGEEELAVAPAGSPGGTAGDIYAATNSAIKIYAPSGALLGALTGPEPCGVAVSPAGHVFVGEYGSTIRELVPSANPVTAADETPSSPSTAALPGICNVAADGLGNIYAANYSGERGAVKLEGIGDTTATQVDSAAATLAVNPLTNEVFANHGDVFSIYDSAGHSRGGSITGQLQGSRGIAVNAASELVYAGNRSKLDVFGPPFTLPDATTDQPSEVNKTTVKLNGTVNPAGTETTYQFEYGPTTSYGGKAPASPAPVGNDSADHHFVAEISGLQPDSTYHYRIVATNSNGTSNGDDVTFTTSGSLSVETTGSPVRTATTARFDSRIFVHERPTTYYFEYGTQGPCDANPCSATDPQPAGSDFAIELVSQMVEGLTPGTTYHYRVVADDGTPESPVTGADMTVTTLSSDAPLSHGRLAGPAGSDRAWEEVNVPDTGGNPVGMLGNSSYGLFFSEDGNRSVYPLRGGTPTTDTGSAFSVFFAERTPQSWQDKDVRPPRSELVGGNWSPESNVATPDLSVVASANTNLGNGNAAIWRMAPDAPPAKLFESTHGENEFLGRLGLSANGTRVVATAKGTVDPNSPSGAPEIYDISSGSPHLASTEPNGQPCGSLIAEKQPAAPTRWVTDDGKHLLFSCNSGLFVHDFDTGQSRSLSGCAEGAAFGAGLIKTTPEAAFFISENALSPDDTGGSPCGNGDIYRFDFSSEKFDCLTCQFAKPAEITGGGSDAATSAAISSDGSRVYFISSTKLIPGAAAGGGIYRLDVASGNLAYVGSAAGGGTTIQTNRDGSVLVFYSSAPSMNAVGGQQNGDTTQAYRYDDRDHSLVCMSCPNDGSVPAFQVEIPFINELPVMSTDGETVTFATSTPLSPLDQNTATAEQTPKVGTDVYEWRDGRLLLVTDGLSEWATAGNGEALPPVPATVSPSGRDVFFMATAQYTPDALDGYRRLYDARLGGGFEFPPPPKPCPLEVCQGTPKGAPEEQAPGTGTFEGATKAPSHKAKTRKKVHKKKAHKKKRHESAKKKNRASNDRRTAR